MPVYTGTTLSDLSYDELVSWLNLSSGGNANLDSWIAQSAQYGVSEIDAVEDLASTYMNFYKDGNGNYTITSFNNTAQISNVNAADSNISTIARNNVQTPLNRGIDSVTGKLNITKFPASGSFGQQASYVLGSVGSAVAAVSTGIALGKAIDGALYNANPEYWDSIGLSSLNPQTWNSITNGDDSWQAGLFNLILGLDPNTGNSQAYIDENAFAYMAYALAQNGWFDASGVIVDMPQTYTYSNRTYSILISPIIVSPQFMGRMGYNAEKLHYATITNNQYPVYCFCFSSGGNSNIEWHFISKGSFTVLSTLNSENEDSFNSYSQGTQEKPMYYFVIHTYYSNFKNSSIKPAEQVNATSSVITNCISPTSNNAYYECILYGSDIHSGATIPGVSNQENATLPNISTWNDIPSTLQSLQSQYPDLWDDALVYDNYQPDGTNPQLRYIPITIPQTTNPTDTQPTSGNQTQTDTVVNPSTSIQTLIDLITKIATEPNPQTQTQTDTQTVPQNPIDTGTGTTSPVVPPTGNASALWSVYHPTQAQVNSFGAWLWGSPFLTNIGKLFTNPIDGVISLHKVFVTPVDSGTGTIVVGTLDSQVSSATVNQQYVYVDCGSINCYEDFGNVFDYPPYTQISIYLPFIGIVPLDVNDVMRSTINVTYGVDVYTGACLAMVNITRDGCTVNMYQYSGVASVEYPLSNVQSSQLISGLLAVGAGVASIAASGGVSAPAVLGIAGGSAAAMKSNVSKSGGFSGNSGAMGGKKPYLIIQRPQTKVADTFPELNGYPTNISGTLNEFTGQVKVANVHVEGIPATDTELAQIETLLKDGVLI